MANRRRFRRYLGICTLLVLLFLGVSLTWLASPAANDNAPTPSSWSIPTSSGTPITYPPVGATTTEGAAEGLFTACILRSPGLFIHNLCLGVCDGPVDTLQKFAECLHVTTFRRGDNAFTVYDLPKRLQRETVRVVASQEFDSENEDVAALRWQMMSTYYGEKFICVDVVADDPDGLTYGTRIVVTRVNDRWYAIPRCGSSTSFYQIADDIVLKEQGP